MGHQYDVIRDQKTTKIAWFKSTLSIMHTRLLAFVWNSPSWMNLQNSFIWWRHQPLRLGLWRHNEGLSRGSKMKVNQTEPYNTSIKRYDFGDFKYENIFDLWRHHVTSYGKKSVKNIDFRPFLLLNPVICRIFPHHIVMK